MLRHRARCSGGRLVARSTLPNKGILGNILLLIFTALQDHSDRIKSKQVKQYIGEKLAEIKTVHVGFDL